MRFKHQTFEAKIDCPVVDCPAEVLVQILTAPSPDGLDIQVHYPDLDLHMVEHGFEPVFEDEEAVSE